LLFGNGEGGNLNYIYFIYFIIAARKVFTCTEDPFTQMLSRQPFDTEELWQEGKGLLGHKEGLLIRDDTTLDKP